MVLHRVVVVLGLGLVVALASHGFAGPTAVNVDSGPSADGVEPHVTNDILVDFSGQYTGSQLLVTLTSGSVYQQSPFGSTIAPSDVLVNVFPDLIWDSFVTQGGLTSESSDGAVGIGGGAVGLGGHAGSQWDAIGLNQAWNPAPGVLILDQANFVVARVTLSPDAKGTWQYKIAAGGEIGVVDSSPLPTGNFGRGEIHGGVMRIVPEPATISLIVWGLWTLVWSPLRIGAIPAGRSGAGRFRGLPSGWRGTRSRA